MLLLRHITVALVFATISLSAQAEIPLYRFVPLKGVETPSAPMLFLSGKTRTLSDFKGKVVMLNLWATWCIPCLKELPTLEALETELSSKGLVVIPLAIQDVPVATIQNFLKKEDVELPHTAMDTKGGLREVLDRGTGIPMTYLIDRKGVMRYQFLGATDWMDPSRQQEIRALLAE